MPTIQYLARMAAECRLKAHAQPRDFTSYWNEYLQYRNDLRELVPNADALIAAHLN
jgi:hypothetical protein